MAILSTAKIVGMLTSAKKTGKRVLNSAGEWVAEIVEDFISGFAGYGWKIWEYVKGKWMLEIDSIRVREQFIVFEMLVSKMRAIIGSLGISQACGKIATVTLSEDGTEYLITLEDETMSFVAHDFIRCQTYTGTKQRFYHVEISSVVDDVIHVPISAFDKDEEGNLTNPPEPGNDIVQFGNSVNRNRQSAIYIHADESGQPAIDIMFDIDSKDWAGKIKIRLGGDIPGGDGARGFYCENGMIKGTDTSGHTVYCIHPDGSAEFGDGSARFNADRSGKLAGGAISWEWDADKNKYVCTMGENVVIKWNNVNDIPGWLTDLDTNKVQIGSNYMISPKLFTGKNTGTATEPILTGIVQGDKCITIDGVECSGIFALVDNEVVFELDPENKKYRFNGEVNATSGVFAGLLSGVQGSFNSLQLSEGITTLKIDQYGFYFKSAAVVELRSTGIDYSLRNLSFHCGNAGFGDIVEGDLLFQLKGIPSKNDLTKYNGVYKNFIYEDNGFLKIGNLDRESTVE